jgi:hypothetical protein
VRPAVAAGNLAAKFMRRAGRRARWTSRAAWEGVKDGFHGMRRLGEGARNRGINAVKDAFRRVRRPVRAASRRKAQIQERWGFYRTEWSIEREIERIVNRERLLVAGPYLSEVGFETLYWVPFLHWLAVAFRVPRERLVAVSRGGVEAWYRGVAGRYIETWNEIDPAEFARRNAARGTAKQYEPTELDRDILEAVARRLGTRDFDVIHPGLMYRLFTLYWSGQRAMGFVDAHARFTRVEAPSLIDRSLLPREYVAVKFYAARSMPDVPEVRTRLRSIVATLAEQVPVVLLDTGLVLEDDHADYTFASGGRVISAKPWMTPQTNLGVQTQIVAGAKAFVGTCGSIAWLAPRLGVDTSALFVDPKWLHAHLAVAMRAYHKLGAGAFAVADLRALDPLGLGARLTTEPADVQA